MQMLRGMQLSFAGTTGAAFAAGVVVVGLASLSRHNRMLAALSLLPGAIGIAMLFLFHRHFYPRFLFVVFPYAALVMVRGAMVAGRVAAAVLAGENDRERFARRAGIVFTAGMILVSTASLHRCYQYPKQDYLGALAYVRESRHPDDPVVAVGMAATCLQRCYGPNVEPVASAAQLDDIRARKPTRPTWLIYTFREQLQTVNPEVWRAIEADFRPARIFRGTVVGGEVMVCRSEPVAE